MPFVHFKILHLKSFMCHNTDLWSCVHTGYKTHKHLVSVSGGKAYSGRSFQGETQQLWVFICSGSGIDVNTQVGTSPVWTAAWNANDAPYMMAKGWKAYTR